MSITYRPPSIEQGFVAEFDGSVCRVVSEGLETGREAASLLVETVDGKARMVAARASEALPLLIAIEHVLGERPGLEQFDLIGDFAPIPELAPFKAPGGLSGTSLGASEQRYELQRTDFFQLSFLWARTGRAAPAPERWTATQERPHPVRPRPAPGTLYRRYVPSITRTVSLRLATLEDLDVFHEWHQQPRVAEFWELNQGKPELGAYLAKALEDPHQFPAILEFDGKPVGYFEMYWTPEDRLGPYYEHDAFDRGFHFLIGDASCLGFRLTDVVIKSALHYLFLDEPRTRRVMAEPRHDNARVLKYVEAIKGWKKLKEFDFPHKRAALLECRREVFLLAGHL